MPTYGKGTHVLCRACNRRIFVTAVRVIIHDDRRLVEVACPRPSCSAYGKQCWYDEDVFVITKQYASHQ